MGRQRTRASGAGVDRAAADRGAGRVPAQPVRSGTRRWPLPGRTRTLLSLLYVRGAAQLQVAQGTVRGTSASYAGSSALGITAVTRFRNQADDLGSLSILTGRRTPFWGIGAWTVAAPMVLGAWVSLGVSRILIAPMT
ncbi:MAG: hypothetical protein QG608_1946, partial [Actinomycetota bacterium]|nr:hypothetical protein [Actinomycetota bacterium]